MRIAVYCSAKSAIPDAFHADATALGKWIGEGGHTLVYGGLDYSMMGDVARATAAAGGKVMGIVPRSRLQHQHPDNTVSILVESLHERKQMMEENADMFVALEGGIGTLDEVFAALASGSFFNEPRQIHLLDRDGIYQPLHQLIENMVAVGLVAPNTAARLHFHPDINSLTNALSNTQL